MASSYTLEQLLALVQAAIRDAPNFPINQAHSEEQLRWLGRVDAILVATGILFLDVNFRAARHSLNSFGHDQGKLMQPLYDALSQLELQVPSSLQGAFIPPGEAWQGFAALLKPVQTACDFLLIVDPYVSGDIFAELVPLSAAKKGTRILTVERHNLHPALLAMAQKWQQTHPPPAPPVEVRYAPATALHDRLIIIDCSEAWLVSQSMKDIAKKSAASVTRADPELAKLKAVHYQDLWRNSPPIS